MPLPPPVVSPAFSGLIGIARADITPPVGIYARNWGAARHDAAGGVHRPLTLTALSLQAAPDGPPHLLMALDLGWWRGLEDEAHVRGGVLEALSLDPARLMMNLAHTHAGPSLTRADADKPGGRLIAPYLEALRAAAVRAAREAVASGRPALLSWTTGRCALAKNRDLQDPERDRILCGYNPSGPADDTLLVGRVTDERGRILATLANYACHPTTLAWDNRLLSPDFVGAMREVVEGATCGAPCLFLQGASGELAPREQYTGDVVVADRHGRELGHAALSALEGMPPPGTRLEYAGIVESGAPLAAWREASDDPSRRLEARLIHVGLPLKMNLPAAAVVERDLKGCADPVLAERLRRKLGVRQIVGDGPEANVPAWVWRVGDAFLVGQPEEAYSALQVELRGRFAPRPVAVMNLVNGSCGYLPPRELYDQDIYQVWQTPFAEGALERLIEACAKGITELQRRT